MDQLSDSALVEMAKAGDKDAFAQLYTRWFDPVYDFLARMVRNRAEAEDIAQDTFLKAMNALGGLQKGASFKSWIFTIARNTALNRIEKSGRTRPLVFQDAEGDEVSLDVVDTDRFGSPEEAAEASAMATLVWEAAAGLDPRQLTLLDLHLRQELDSGEIADVLGVTKNNGYVMLNRLKKAVEDAIGAFIMFKDGRSYCGDLDALLSVATVEGMSPDVRKLVDGHLSQCEDCQERKKKLVSPLAVFGAFAAVPMPFDAKAHILEGLMRDWPGPAAGAGGELPPPPEDGLGALPGDRDGLDKPTFGEKFMLGLKKYGALGGVIAGLFLLGAALIPASPLSPLGDGTSVQQGSPNGGETAVTGLETATPTSTTGGSQGQGGVTPTGTPSTTPTTPAGGTTAPAGNQTPTPTNTVGPGTPTPTQTSTSTPTRTPTPTATPTPTPTTIPCAPTLSTNTGTLTISPGGSSSFLLLASCGTTGFLISGGDGWAITVGSGAVSFGNPQTIQVSVDATGLGEGFHSTTLFIQGDHNTTTVTVNTTVSGASPVIQRFDVICAAAAGTVTFTAAITDDFGVASATVAYAIDPTGPGSVELQQSGTTWSATITLDRDERISSATLTARDAAGHTATATAGC